jgi:prevent-host-death family protein
MKKDIRIVTIDEAKKQLSKLVDQAAKGEPFIIAKGGKPMVEVTATSHFDARAMPWLHAGADRYSGGFRSDGRLRY